MLRRTRNNSFWATEQLLQSSKNISGVDRVVKAEAVCANDHGRNRCLLVRFVVVTHADVYLSLMSAHAPGKRLGCGYLHTNVVFKKWHAEKKYRFAGVKGYLDKITLNEVQPFEKKWVAYIKSSHPNILSEIETKGAISDELMDGMHSAMGSFMGENTFQMRSA